LGTIGRKIRTETFPNDELIPLIKIYKKKKKERRRRRHKEHSKKP